MRHVPQWKNLWEAKKNFSCCLMYDLDAEGVMLLYYKEGDDDEKANCRSESEDM